MIALGPDASSTLLKRFEQKDADSICKKIADFPLVNQEMKDCVLDEFSEIIESSVNSNLGGLSFAKKTLELAHGDFKANNILEPHFSSSRHSRVYGGYKGDGSWSDLQCFALRTTSDNCIYFIQFRR